MNNRRKQQQKKQLEQMIWLSAIGATLLLFRANAHGQTTTPSQSPNVGVAPTTDNSNPNNPTIQPFPNTTNPALNNPANPGNFGDPFGLVAVDKNFPSDCLPSLQRALNLVRRAATRDPRCNCLFTNIGDRRSLKELVDDPRISIQYDPVQEYTEGGATIAYTSAADKSNIYIDPLGCRLGRWALASALVHELTHITLTPAPGQEELAQSVQLYCGFKVYVTARPTVITVRP